MVYSFLNLGPRIINMADFTLLHILELCDSTSKEVIGHSFCSRDGHVTPGYVKMSWVNLNEVWVKMKSANDMLMRQIGKPDYQVLFSGM